MAELVCALDLGTSRLKAALIDGAGKIHAMAAAAAPHEAGDDNFAFAPEAYCRVGFGLIREALTTAGIDPGTVAAVAVTNQRATIVPVGADGLAAGLALSWQDPRGAGLMAEFADQFGAARYNRLTGLPPCALWSLTRLLWLRQDQPEQFARAHKFVLLHDYLLRRLGAEEFITDYSNASLTGLFDLTQLAWSRELLAAVGLAEAQLPRLVPAGSVAGRLSRAAATATGLTSGTPLVVGGGDQQCAALGMGAVDEGEAGLCLGTAAVVSCPVPRPVPDTAGGFFCTAHVVPDRWVVEGFANTFGSSFSWGANVLGLEAVTDLDALASASPPGAGGVIFVPFLAGSGSPEFAAHARGAFFNLHLAHRRNDLARAIIEGSALEMRRIVDAAAPYVRLDRIIVAGGLPQTSLAAGCLRGILGRDLVWSDNAEATLLGAALLAWRGAGRISNLRDGARAALAATRAITMKATDNPALAEQYRRYCRQVTLLLNRENQING